MHMFQKNKWTVIDLSPVISEDMEVYPGDPEVSVEQVQFLEKDGWNLRKLSMGTHTGSHVDAFSHMAEGGKSIDEIPVDRFFGVARKVTVDDDFPFEYGLFFETEVDEKSFHKIMEARPLFVAGLISEELERALLNHEVITYTDFTNLDLLPEDKDFFFFGFPLNIKGGDGSPIRGLAFVPKE